MSDLTAATAPKSDQLNADDLIGGPRVIKITSVEVARGVGAEQPVSIHFEGDGGRPYKPCKSMVRVMVAAWGNDSSKFAGRSLKLYRDPDVTWAGLAIGGIRISHMSDIAKEMTLALTVTKSKRTLYRVERMDVSSPDGAAREPILDAARAAATGGKEALQAHWKGISPDDRAVVNTIIDEIKETALRADEALAAFIREEERKAGAQTGGGPAK